MGGAIEFNDPWLAQSLGAVVAGKRVLEVDLPPETLIVLLSRNGEFLVPRGGTVFQAGDKLLVLTDPAELSHVRTLLESRSHDASDQIFS